MSLFSKLIFVTKSAVPSVKVLSAATKEAATRDCRTSQRNHRLDRPAIPVAVTDDEIGEPIQGRPGIAGQLEVLVVIRRGLIDPDLVDHNRGTCRTGDAAAETVIALVYTAAGLAIGLLEIIGTETREAARSGVHRRQARRIEFRA